MSGPRRWPALVVLVAVLATLVALDRTGGADSAGRRGIVSAVAARDAASPSATWFCAGGTLGDATTADHRVVIANTTAERVPVELTVFPAQTIAVDPPASLDDLDEVAPPPEVVVGDPVERTLTVEAGARRVVRLADVDGLDGDLAAAMVETRGGVIVEHQLVGPAGAVTSRCTTGSSPTWYVAGGTTRRGTRQVVSIFNPFPVDAVVTLTFATTEGERSPNAYEGLPVAARSVLAVDITDVVTLAEVVATRVEARAGRVVVDRVVAVEALDGATGLSVHPGAPEPATTWVFPEGRLDAAAGDLYVVFNPGDQTARVDLEIRTDPRDKPIEVEPVSVSVRPGAVETIVLTPTLWQPEGRRVTDASLRVADDEVLGPLTYWVAARSLNGQPVVVERLGGDAAAAAGAGTVTWVEGSAVQARQWAGAAVDVAGVVVANPQSDTIAIVEVRTGGVDGETLASVEVPPGGRRLITLDDLADIGSLVVHADVEVVAVSWSGVTGQTRPLAPVGEVTPADVAAPLG